MRLPTLPFRLDGPAPSLPPVLDLASEWWWGLAPRLRLLLVALAVGAVLLALGARGTLGAPAPVEVATAVRALPAGYAITPADVQVQRWPAELVPDGAASPDVVLSEPGATDTDTTLTTMLPAGAVLTRDHLGTGGLGALVAEGRAVAALPTELVPDPRVGTRLDLVATDEPGGARPLAIGARIVRVDGDLVWVDVPGDDGGEVAAAAARHAVAAVVRPTPAVHTPTGPEH